MLSSGFEFTRADRQMMIRAALNSGNLTEDRLVSVVKRFEKGDGKADAGGATTGEEDTGVDDDTYLLLAERALGFGTERMANFAMNLLQGVDNTKWPYAEVLRLKAGLFLQNEFLVDDITHSAAAESNPAIWGQVIASLKDTVSKKPSTKDQPTNNNDAVIAQFTDQMISAFQNLLSLPQQEQSKYITPQSIAVIKSAIEVILSHYRGTLSVKDAIPFRARLLPMLETLPLKSETLLNLSAELDAELFDVLSACLRSGKRKSAVNGVAVSELLKLADDNLEKVKERYLPYRSDRVWNSMIRLHSRCVKYGGGVEGWKMKFTVESLLEFFNSCRADGYRPNIETINQVLGIVADPDVVYKYQRGEAAGDAKEPTSVNEIRLTRDQRLSEAQELYHLLKTYRLKATDVTYATLFQCCAPDLTATPKQPRCSPVWKSLESAMMKEGVGHTQVTLKALFRILGEGNDFESIIQRFNDIKHVGSKLSKDLEFYNLIFRLASKRVSTSKYVLHDLRHTMAREMVAGAENENGSDQFSQPNYYTYLHLMRCCYRSNDLVTAMQLIEEIVATQPRTGIKPDGQLFWMLLQMSFSMPGSMVLDAIGRRVLRTAVDLQIKMTNERVVRVIISKCAENAESLDSDTLKLLFNIANDSQIFLVPATATTTSSIDSTSNTPIPTLRDLLANALTSKGKKDEAEEWLGFFNTTQ
ncbi:hypothetical protein HDU76_009586 [Blyttiomyces sp. JEL0837]|nr:hypothetical protein HDU76_009586 [Blyttiomyces sp. JEL0837]